MTAVATKPKFANQSPNPDPDLTTVVQSNYLKQVGKPDNFYKMAGGKVGYRCYRMTMWVHKGDKGPGVGPSHIVKTDEKGTILTMDGK